MVIYRKKLQLSRLDRDLSSKVADAAVADASNLRAENLRLAGMLQAAQGVDGSRCHRLRLLSLADAFSNC